MDDGEPEVKVTDRRHFTADGDVRPGEPETAPADTASAESAPSDSAPADSAAEAEPPMEDAAAAPVTFGGFIISLATQAATLLNGERKDLGGARQVISVLEMLKDKTEGRRTEEESKIIDMVLFDLRMAFVGSARGSAS